MARPAKHIETAEASEFKGMTLDQLDQFLAAKNAERVVLQYTPWHLTAAVMKARGRTNGQIAEELGKNISTVISTFKVHPELLEWGIQQVVNPEKMFTPMLPKAAKVFDEVLDLNPADAATHKVRADIARDVFDRAYGKPVTRNITDSRGTITIHFGDDDPDASDRNQTAILAQLVPALTAPETVE